ncbi:MAG: synthase, partial [Chloroflexota bacterium]|nr:synthase [Chloroflexota bacterium]
AYPMYLRAGINDWGGISPVTLDHINPERAWPQVRALANASAEVGFTLRERLCLYPEYVDEPRFVRSRLANRMHELVDGDSLVRAEETRW